MKEEISLLDIIPIIKKHYKWLIVIVTLCMAVSLFVSLFFMPKQYTSSAKMIASFTTIDDKDKVNAITSGYLEASEKLATTYREILKSNYTVKTILEEVKKLGWENITESMIKSSIDVSSAGNTEMISISITTTDPELSYDICRVFTDVTPSIIEEKYYGKLMPLDEGQLPTSPSSPIVLKNTVIGGIVGIILSAVLIMILFVTDNKVSDGAEVAKRFSLPILGNVPCFTRKKKKQGSVNGNADSIDVGRAQQNFFVIEAYKNIRTNLMYTLSSHGTRVIAVSGAESEAGKSITCANLSIAFAQNGCKVLLIDADMRKPVQQKLFKKLNTTGLSKVLSGQAEFDEAVQRGAVNGLDLLTSGPIPPNPSELMGSDNMKKLIQKVGETYDFVIIDTPPVNYVTDCLTIASIISGIVLVARHGHTEYSELMKAVDNIKSAGGKISGVIVSDVRSSTTSKYYKSYIGNNK